MADRPTLREVLDSKSFIDLNDEERVDFLRRNYGDKLGKIPRDDLKSFVSKHIGTGPPGPLARAIESVGK